MDYQEETDEYEYTPRVQIVNEYDEELEDYIEKMIEKEEKELEFEFYMFAEPD